MGMDVDKLHAKFEMLAPVLDERTCRLWAAAEAQILGRGGVSAVKRATGISGRRIWAGKRELAELRQRPPEQPPQRQRVRRQGGGRKRLTSKDATLLSDLEALIEPTARGDPESPLRWTTKSVRKLADELCAKGHSIGRDTVDGLLQQLGYSLQAPRKEAEGKQHPDRDAQFRHIARETRAFQRRGQPVVSVDTKKKELVGNFKNPGREWFPQGAGPEVNVHDFPSMAQGKAIPYGVYDVTRDAGWVNVGTDHDTPEFAVESLRRWWQMVGRATYPDARALLVVADAGGSNSPRSKMWKRCLQTLTDDTGLSISVSHYPPGTSKWNKIEHRLFSQIAINWRGRPMTSYETIIELIGHTTTRSGLCVHAALDARKYPVGLNVSDEEVSTLNIKKSRFHGDWNYTVRPIRHSVAS
jgi:transposase